MARKARPVAVAKAPKARAADESSSPVLGRAWLPCLCLGSLTSEDDTEVVIEADNEALADSEALIESETDWLVEIEALVLADSLSETEALIESETDWLVEIEALVLCDSETDVETD